ncbi:MAG: hypothetical protein CSA47_01065 [Gammaproteobacteria bacterium]|nr:MAG: hypothetical protein CSA47_01065 [Gammaproteobacteria bacterium]
MKIFAAAVVIGLPLTTLASDSQFEINKKNCNLPMTEIRKILPKKADQDKALKACTEKAIREKWKRTKFSPVVNSNQ